MNVLVTGGAGYIGSHTVVALSEAGRRVVVLDDLSNSSERAVDAVRALVSADVAFVRGDAADVDLVSQAIVEHDVDEVVHFAAFKSVSESVERPLAYFANNMGSLIGVVALSEAGRRVVVLDDLSNSSERAVDAVRALVSADIAFVRGDAADVDLVSQAIVEHDVDEVVHFAAFKSVSESVERPLAYFANNMGSLIGVVEAMAGTGIDRLVFSSSCTVYGEPDEVPVTEESPTGAANPYGWTKLHGEQFLAQVAAASELDVMLLRYFNPVGAHPSGTIGEDPNGIPENLVPYLMQVATGQLDRLRVFGGDYETPDGTAIRDYLHVVDLAEGHVAALDALASHPGCTAVNLGTGRGYSVLEVVTAAEAVLGRPIPHEVVGRRPGDVARIWAGTEWAEQVLGWTATRGLAEMLADHWRWQEANPDGFGD